jgi:uncharacterized OB-fold protein
MIEGLLLPGIDEDSAPFYEYAAAGELRVQRCAACGARRMPPRPMCPNCRSFDVTWELLSGRGRIWSLAVPHPPLLPAYAALAPFNVIVVETDEDPAIRFCGNLVLTADGPIDEVDPATIEIGEPVRVVFPAPVDDGDGPVVMPQWVRGWDIAHGADDEDGAGG